MGKCSRNNDDLMRRNGWWNGGKYSEGKRTFENGRMVIIIADPCSLVKQGTDNRATSSHRGGWRRKSGSGESRKPVHLCSYLFPSIRILGKQAYSWFELNRENFLFPVWQRVWKIIRIAFDWLIISFGKMLDILHLVIDKKSIKGFRF